MGKILLFHVEKQKEQQIKELCEQRGDTCVTISPKNYGQQMGYLAGITGFSKKVTKGCEEFPEEMLVFSGFTKEKMEEFLDEYQKVPISRIALKAILTPHNIVWSAEALYKELEKEHSYYEKK